MDNREQEPLSTRLTNSDRDRLWSRVLVAGPDECWLWTGARQASGHGQIKLFGRKGQAYNVHRVAYVMAKGDLTPDQVVRHTCDAPACCNPAHLIPGTPADNVADRVARGRSASGTTNGRAKLNWEIVETIREQLRHGVSAAQLAKTYGVDHKTIRLLRDNVTWTTPPTTRTHTK